MSPTFASDAIHRHPLAFSVVLVGAAVAAELLVKATSELLSLELSVITTGVISGAVLSLLGALVMTRLGGWGELGLTRRDRPSSWPGRSSASDYSDSVRWSWSEERGCWPLWLPGSTCRAQFPEPWPW